MPTAAALAGPVVQYLLCRYVDLIVNEGVRDTLKSRARMMGALRRVLEDRGFLEVRNQAHLSVDWWLSLPLHGLPEIHILAVQLILCISANVPMKGPLAAGIGKVIQDDFWMSCRSRHLCWRHLLAGQMRGPSPPSTMHCSSHTP